MRQPASFLLIAFAVPALAADIWRWKDENGVVHYSDQPTAGAVRINQGPIAASPAPPATTPAPAPVPTAPAVFSYTGCTVLKPGNDEVFHAVSAVDASLQISPGLQPGHRVQVMLDGQPRADWPASALSFTLAGLYRGTHTLAVQVLDPDGRPLCVGAARSFHIRQPSILSPARQQATKPRP